MISKRILMKWRREALSQQEQLILGVEESNDCIKKVLTLTQELIDQALLKEIKK